MQRKSVLCLLPYIPRAYSVAKYASSISMVMDQPAFWVWPSVTIQFRIFLSTGSSINIFHAAYGEFEALFLTAFSRPADALKRASSGDRSTFVLVSGFQVTPDPVTKSKKITRQIS